MVRCYLCDCRLKDNYEQCECCEHQFCYDCYSRIENFFINMPDHIKEEMLCEHRYNSIICPCSCDNGYICLNPHQMEDFLNEF